MAKRISHALFALLAAVVAGLLFLVSGCGGGGGSSSSLGGLNVFITDDLSTGFDDIWVTIFQVELRDSSGGFHTVFSSADGVTVDVTSLNDGAPRFLYLGNDQVPSGTFTGARVTMARDLTLVATGSPTGEACTFDPSLNLGVDQSRVTFDFASAQSLSGNDSVVLDFDLPNWNKVGSVVTPALTQGDDSNLSDPGRHESEDYHGTIVGLSGTSPNQSFTLRRTGGDIGVNTDSNTIVFNENSNPGPHMASGQRVEVRGRFDVSTNRLLATKVKIEDEVDDDTKVEGATFDLDTVNLTVEVQVREAEGFLPSGPTVHVQFSETTRFFTKAGAPLTLAEMLTALGSSPAVEAEGTYEAGSNTLTATKIKLHQEDEDEHEVEAKGAASAIDSGAGTFDVSLSSWFGFTATSGQVVHVTTDGTTVFMNDSEATMTSGDFFAAITNGSDVEVEGVYDSGTITAKKVKLEDESGAGQPEAKGYVSSFDAGTGDVTVNLIEWFGFSGSFGAPQAIHTNGSTEFKNEDGDSITAEQFFSALVAGHVIDAKGSYGGGVLTATRARLRD